MKSYLKWSLSLLLDHFLAVLASALIFGFLGAWEFGIVTLLCTVLSVCCALLIPYHDSWKIGTVERNALKREGANAPKTRGITAGVLATIPSFVIALFAFLCAEYGWSFGLVMDQSLVEVIYRAWFLPFSFVFPYLEQLPFLYFAPLASLPVSAGVGYFFGRNKLMLRDYLYYRGENDAAK